MKKICISTVGYIFIFLFSSCFSTQKATAPSKQTFTFGYKTPNTAKPGSATILLGLIRPAYANNFSFGGFELFDNFRKYMGDDIQQLLNDKGFNLMNKNYGSFDELTYDDKRSVQIALDIKIVPEFTTADGTWTAYKPFSWYANSPYVYGYRGTVSLTGHIVIKGIEPLTNQQIFTKSLDIPVIQNISITTGHNLPSNQIDYYFLYDPWVYNAVGAALQQSYTNIMHQIDTYLDPQELTSYKTEIQELKAKKIY